MKLLLAKLNEITKEANAELSRMNKNHPDPVEFANACLFVVLLERCMLFLNQVYEVKS